MQIGFMILVTQSTIGYVFTLGGGTLSQNILNKLLFHNLPWKQILFL